MIAEDNSQLITESYVSVLEEATSNLHISDARHVIFRNHLQIPEALQNGLVFGSFDSSFSLGSKYANGPDVEKSPTPAESSQENIEITKGPSPRCVNIVELLILDLNFMFNFFYPYQIQLAFTPFLYLVWVAVKPIFDWSTTD